MSTVSLYIPCYNAGAFIDSCLEGVKRQIHSVDEVIVVDDGSTDDTVERAGRYGVKIIRHGENKGLAAARNTAVMNARSEFIASLDADCVPSPEWLGRLMQNFTDSDIAGVGGRLVERFRSCLADRWRSVYMRQNWGDERIEAARFLFGSNNVYRKEALLKTGPYNTIYRTNYEDCDMSLRVRKEGYRLIYDPSAVAEHLRTDTVRSVLNTHWRWTFIGTTGTMRIPDNLYNVACKTYDNFVYLFKDMIKNDIVHGRPEFLPLDVLSWFHHIYKDAVYYLSSKLTTGGTKS